ncbi:MAG: FtsH protease activity modulator HflK [Alphaproteobacteria bacterium]|nr:FtsH protease activity modulator HflK [Alphaproteobacteria bacterium]
MGSFQQSGGGPWGGGPWGGPPRGGGNGQAPRGRGPQPPNFEELLRRSQDQFRRWLPGGAGGGNKRTLYAAIAAVAVALWLASGFYRVQPDEQGVVLRFGRYDRTSAPGLNYRLPSPIESVLTPKVTRVNRLEVGYRSSAEATTSARMAAARQVPEEALMLTGDENIVDINFTVFWLINDAQRYLFNIRNPEGTVKAAAESAMREVVGRTPIASALAEGRKQIEDDTQKLLQNVLDSYGSGITVTQVQLQKVDPPTPVIDAFRDVQRARADQERKRNEAEAYRNGILPVARGEAVRLVQEAEAYKQQVVAEAQGDAQRFLSVYNAYLTAQDVTTRRLYIETMETILKNASKIVIDKSAQTSGVVPYLPLPQLNASERPASAGGQLPPNPAPRTGPGAVSVQRGTAQ